MKDENFINLLNESIRLELTVADLYHFFLLTFPDDASFWWQMVIEEKSHAAILRSGKETFLPLKIFPKNLVSDSIEELSNNVAEIENVIKKYEDKPPSRSEAFNTALKFELSPGEVDFQEFIDDKNESGIGKIFQKLIDNDSDHPAKLIDYMKNKNIEIKVNI